MNEQQDTQLTLSDLATIKNLIEVSCTRGSFRADEMRTVGEIYEKLSKFLDEIVKNANASNAAPAGLDGPAQDQQGEAE